MAKHSDRAIRSMYEATALSLGYQTLKEEQLEVMTFVRGMDVFAVLPMVFGKSLCYACLPPVFLCTVYLFGLVAIITPLNALIKQQVCSVFDSSKHFICKC